MNRLLSLPSLLITVLTTVSLNAQVTILNTFQPAAGTGNWHVAGNWSQGIPIRGHTAVIPAGTIARIQSAPATIDVSAIQVQGTLDVPGPQPALNFTVRTDRIDVHGTFSIGSSTTPFTGTGTILLTHQPVDIGGEAKHIEVHPGASLLLYGNPAKKSWARLTNGAQWQGSLGANPSNLLVEGSTLGWSAADQLAISTTDFDLAESETATITSAAVVGPDTSITLNAPMTRAHFSRRELGGNGKSVDMRAAVGLLNRNIKIVGDTDNVLRWGGDVRILQTPSTQTTTHVSYVEFYRMGKYGNLGRYPMHFHVCGDMAGGIVGPRGTITGCSFHECYHRAMSIHGTHRVEVRDNVAYDIYGHAYFLEDGSETGNLLENNLGMNIKTPIPDPAINPPQLLGTAMTWPGASTVAGAFKFFRYHDQNPATFWIPNYGNRLIGNVALGSEGYGFTFDMAIKDFDDNGQIFGNRTLSGPFAQLINPAGSPAFKQFQFDDNTAGGCGRTGFFCDEEGAGRARPVIESGGALVGHASLGFVRCTAFKCRMAGVWYRQYGEAIWTDCRFADNALAAYFASEGWLEDQQNWEIPYAAGPFHQVYNWPTLGAPAMSHQLLEHSLVIGDSTNTGRPGNVDWDATLGRSLPHHRELQPQYPNVPGQPIRHRIVRTATTDTIWSRGVTIYDGLVGITDTHFENFTNQSVTGGTRRAAVFTINGVGDFHYVHGGIADPWRVDPRNYTRAITYANVPIDNQVAFPPQRMPWQNPATNPQLTTMGWIYASGLNEVVIHDLDGSVTGMGPGFLMNVNNPLLWRNAAGVIAVFGAAGDHLWNYMPDTANQIAALQIELPWDWTAAQVGVTSGFRNMRLALPPPQAADAVELYDMNAYGVVTMNDYVTRQRSTTSHSKRLFGTTVLAGPSGTTPPQYELSYQNVVLAPDAAELAVRMRFGPAGGAIILKLPRPSSFTVKSVWTGKPPAIGALGATSSVAAINAYPITNNIYQLITQHTVAPTRAALDTMAGNGWYQSGNDLYLRVEMPVRPTGPGANPVFGGADSILVVKFF